MPAAVLLWTLLVSSILAAPVRGEALLPNQNAEKNALVQRLTLERAAAVASVQRLADEREEQLFAELAQKDRRLRAELGTRRAAQAELAKVTAERQKLVDEIAARDRRFAAEIEEYGQQIASIASSPDPRKREALQRYAEGNPVEAFDDLVSIQEELDKANDKASAAGWRELGALALDLKDRGKKDTNAAIDVFENAQRKNPEHAWGWIELRRLYQEAGRLPDARRAAEQALAHAQNEPDRAAAGIEIGDVFMAEGDLQARSRYEEVRKITERLAAADPTRADVQRYLSASLENLGDVLRALGDLPGARARFEQVLGICERLAAADPTHADAQRARSSSLIRLGDVLFAEGNLPAARARYEQSLNIAEPLAAANPTRARAQRDLSFSLERLGNVLIAAGDLPAARARYEQDVSIREHLAQANPASAEAQLELGISLNKLGDVLGADGDLAGARSRYEQGLKITEQLAAANPASAATQRDLSVVLNQLGDILDRAGDVPAARNRYEQGLKITEQLAADAPTSADAQRDLSDSLDNLGDLLIRMADLPSARSRYEQSLTISERLAAADPASAEAQRDLIISHWNLGDLPGGESHWNEALRIALDLQKQGRLAPGDAGLIDALRMRVAAAEKAKP